jgi:predicted PurR-regulated permease PerM
MEKRMPSLGGGLVAVAAAVIIFWGLRSLAFILAPLAMAMVITIAIIPLPGWLTRKGVKPGLSLVMTILAVVGSLALVVFITVASLGKLAGVLPSYTANLAAQSSTLESLGASLGLIQSGIPVTTTAAMTSTVAGQAGASLAGLNLSSLTAPSPAHTSDLAGAIVVAAGKMIAQVFVVLFIFVFMLSAALSLQNKERVAGLSTDSPAVATVQQFTAEVRQYVNIMAVINFLVAVGNTVILGLLGIPFALLWGILSFFMGFIPSIGWWISLIPPFLIAWAQFGVGTAVFVLLSYVLINGGVQNIVQPKMMGKGLRISPLVVFISVIFWATVLGGLGALIAVPMTMIVMKILESAESTRWIAGVMRIGSGSDEEEEKQAFERLRGVASRARSALPFGGRRAAGDDGAPQSEGGPGEPVALA